MRFCRVLIVLLVVILGAVSRTAYADCTGPAGLEGHIVYNTTYKMVQFCNGTDWVAMGGTGSGGGGGSGNGAIIDFIESQGVTVDPVTIAATSNKWPDYIVCKDSGVRVVLPLNYYFSSGSGGVRYLGADTGNLPRYYFYDDGSYNSSNYVDANCGASAGDIDTICTEIGCGFFGGGGGGGATALSGLTDVDTTGVADGNCLVYNNGTSKWEDGACGGGGADNLGDHTATQDVDLATHDIVNVNQINLAGVAGAQPQGGGGGGLPTCSEGQGLIYTSGAWACSEQVPSFFSFTDVTDQAVSTLITSNSVNIGGITGSIAVSVSGQGNPKVRINGGSWVTSGTITNGQSLEVQLTSSSSNNTMYSATVTVGGGSNQWNVTTIPACGGVQVGGYCWHASGDGQDCDTACASYGGCDLTGTKDYAGSNGSNPNCTSVLGALGLGSGAVSTTGGVFGCGYNGVRYRALSATTCATSSAGLNRACACAY